MSKIVIEFNIKRYSCLYLLLGCLRLDEPLVLPLELHKVSRVAAQLQVLQPVGLPCLRHRLLRPHVRHGADLRRRDRWHPG